jgi:WD40 repeat protein
LAAGYLVTAKVWNASTGAEEATISRPVVPEGTRPYSSIAFSPDGSRILTAEGTASLWDARTGKLLQRLPRDRGDVQWAAFSPDGLRIATAMGFSYSGMIWDAGTWEPQVSLVGHTAVLSGASFTSSGFYVATRPKDKSSVAWIAKIGGTLFRIECPPPTPGMYGAVFSPDGRRVVTGGSTAALWDTASGRRLLTLLDAHDHVNDETDTMCFSSDGTKIAIGTFNQYSRVFDASDGKLLDTLEGQGWVKVLGFSPDGKRLMTLQNKAVVWDLAAGRKIMEFPASGWWGNTTAGYSPDGSRIVTADLQGVVRIWNAESGTAVTEPADAGQAVVWFSRFSPDGKTILTTHYEETCRLWDAANGKLLQTLTGQGSAGAGFSADGNVVMAASSHGTIKFWRTSDAKELCTVSVFDDGSWTVVSPDGRYDSNLGADAPYLHWVIVDPKTSRLTAAPLAQFAAGRYSPGLFTELVGGGM